MFFDTFVLLAANAADAGFLAELKRLNGLNLGDIIATVTMFHSSHASSKEICMGSTYGHYGSTCRIDCN